MTYDPTDHRTVTGNDWIPLVIVSGITVAAVGGIVGMHVGFLPPIVKADGTGAMIGTILVSLAGVIAVANCYLSFGRYWLHRARGKDSGEYHFVSGVPGVGSLLLAVGAIVSPPSVPLLSVAALIALVDTGGLPWFLIALLLDYFRRV